FGDAAVILARVGPLDRIPERSVTTLRGGFLVIAGDLALDRAADLLGLLAGCLDRAFRSVRDRFAGLLRVLRRSLRDRLRTFRRRLAGVLGAGGGCLPGALRFPPRLLGVRLRRVSALIGRSRLLICRSALRVEHHHPWCTNRQCG